MWHDLRTAFGFLTVLPLGVKPGEKARKPGYAFSYFPLVGLVIGALIALVGVLPWFSGNLQAFLVLLGWVILTGGLHLDGFGDSCDGLLATTTPERRLEIMKDPRAGSWAVVGLVVLLLGKWAAIGALLAQAGPPFLLIPPVLGRLAMTLAVAGFPSARATGIGVYFRNGLGRGQLVAGTLTALAVALPFGVPGLACFGLIGLIVFGFGRWAAGRLGGGLTGDIYGATCELVELVCLLILVALTAPMPV